MQIEDMHYEFCLQDSTHFNDTHLQRPANHLPRVPYLFGKEYSKRRGVNDVTRYVSSAFSCESYIGRTIRPGQEGESISVGVVDEGRDREDEIRYVEACVRRISVHYDPISLSLYISKEIS